MDGAWRLFGAAAVMAALLLAGACTTTLPVSLPGAPGGQPAASYTGTGPIVAYAEGGARVTITQTTGPAAEAPDPEMRDAPMTSLDVVVELPEELRAEMPDWATEGDATEKVYAKGYNHGVGHGYADGYPDGYADGASGKPARDCSSGKCELLP